MTRREMFAATIGGFAAAVVGARLAKPEMLLGKPIRYTDALGPETVFTEFGRHASYLIQDSSSPEGWRWSEPGEFDLGGWTGLGISRTTYPKLKN